MKTLLQDELPDPEAAAGNRRRRKLATGGAVLLALVTAGTAALVIRDVESGHRHVVVVQQPPPPPGSTSRTLADGTPVAAAQLYAYPVFVDPDHGFSLARGTGGGTSERLVATGDGGATWRVVGSSFPVAGTFTTILFTDEQHGYVFGPAGLIVTSDGGRDWEQPPLTGEVQRVIPAYGDVWAVLTNCGGAPGETLTCPVHVEISDDAGKTWRLTAPPPTSEGSPGGAVLGRVSASRAYVLTWGSKSSGLVRTDDGGVTWHVVPDPCATGWATEGMAALARGSMWLVCGARPTVAGQVKVVYRSEDGGGSWVLEASTGLVPSAPEPVGSLSLTGDLSQLATVTPAQAWVGLAGVGVLETNDGGRTWAPVPGVEDPPGKGDVGVTFIRSPDGAITDGWAIGFGYAVWRTTDATNWRLVAGG